MPNAKKIQTAKELPLGKKLKWVLKNSELGKTKGTRIQINELENGYVSGLIKSPLFTGMSIVKRHSKIQGYLRKSLSASEREKIIGLLTAAPADLASDRPDK